MTSQRSGGRNSTPPSGRNRTVGDANGCRQSLPATTADEVSMKADATATMAAAAAAAATAVAAEKDAAAAGVANGTAAQAEPFTHHSSSHEAAAYLQVNLLSGARGMFQMTRICMGPLMVAMASEYGYSNEDKGQILSAFAAGYALTQIVGGMAADSLGGGPVISFGLLTSALALFLLPAAADAGLPQVWWLLWAMGFTQGPTYPAQLVTTAKWAKGSLRSYASALGAAGSTAGALFAMGLTPVLAARLGWRTCAAVMGSTTLLFGVLWQALGRSRPAGGGDGGGGASSRQSSGASTPAAELSTDVSKPAARDVRRILRRISLLFKTPILAVFSAHAIHNFVRYFAVGWMPTFYNEILHASPDQAAIHLMIPDILGLAMSFASAHVGLGLQQSGRLSALGVRRVFASISFLGSAVGMVGTAYSRTTWQVCAWQCVVHGLATLQGLGFGANYLDVSRFNGGMVTGVGNTVATFASFASPVFASWVLSSGGGGGAAAGGAAGAVGLEDWQRLFMFFAASNMIGAGLFVPLCSVTPVDLHEAPTDKGE